MHLASATNLCCGGGYFQVGFDMRGDLTAVYAALASVPTTSEDKAMTQQFTNHEPCSQHQHHVSASQERQQRKEAERELQRQCRHDWVETGGPWLDIKVLSTWRTCTKSLPFLVDI